MHPSGDVYNRLLNHVEMSDVSVVCLLPGVKSVSFVPRLLTSVSVGCGYGCAQDQFYLETSACAVCHTPETDFKTYKLKELEAETKYTHNTKSVKLVSPHAIQQIVFRISDISTTK